MPAGKLAKRTRPKSGGGCCSQFWPDPPNVTTGASLADGGVTLSWPSTIHREVLGEHAGGFCEGHAS
eukprot:1151866-Pelagomonas_calceolata.AAC.5